MKIRINDLARELEVKSRAILDALPKVGVTEKKTHSSSVEEDEAEKVRKFLTGPGSPSAIKEARKIAAADEIKTKIDLSRISKPGDVLRALRQTSEPAPAAAPPPAAPKVAPKAEPRPAAAAGKVAAPPPPAAKIPAPAIKTPVPAVVVVPPSKIVTPVTAPNLAPPAATSAPAAHEPLAAQPPASSSRPAAPSAQPPARRIITPHAGPRPVYQAPTQQAPPPVRSAPPAQSYSAPSGPTPGGPLAQRPPQQPGRPGMLPRPGMSTSAGRPAPGRPVPGQPIFQRPRPSAPGQRPGGFTPGGPNAPRRQHPTRPMPAGGARPLGVGPGLPPPGLSPRPTSRPGGPNRRPGQRYVPRGIKEGPMKGFVPPSRQMAVQQGPLPITRAITITEGISVKDLAEKLDMRAKDLITRLVARGVFATVNQTLDSELARELAEYFGASTDIITFEQQAAHDMDETAVEAGDTAAETATRPPVVTIMGHVDHGKTSLLDAIRETNVAGGEAGGITQHIGAYKVRITKADSPAFGREIVFLDTPGHQAFTRMRARGAKVTDIVVIVVAADDGVMPQTLEAIDHAQAAKVPLIVAVNKIDKPDAMPERVKKQLGDRGLVPEDWGGSTVFVDVSAKKHTNLDLLMEMICLVADLQELKATADRPATGSVLEAKLDRGRGAVATVLVQNGTLRTGDTFIVGNTFGKVRAMFDDRGNAIEVAPPSTPVEVLGLEGLPQAGDQLSVVSDREKAKQVSQYREQKAREAYLAKSSRVSLESLAEQIKNAGIKELPLIVKGDVQGSVEVLADSLGKIATDRVKIKILHTGVGAITETDVLLASASNAIIIGFNVRPERKAQELAEQEEVDIRLHSIIYELQDEIKRAMTGLLEPLIKETFLGRAEVRDTFRVPKVGVVAGCYVQEGLIKRDASVRLLRDNVVIFTGKIVSLRRFKDDASEVRNGLECGIGIANYNDVKVGDIIEAFVIERVAAEAIA